MAVDPHRLLNLELPDHECSWTQRDCQIYALATGFGQDPMDERELPYVVEGPDFKVSPTAAITLYYDDRWMRESGVDLAMSLHGEQRNIFHRPIPPLGPRAGFFPYHRHSRQGTGAGSAGGLRTGAERRRQRRSAGHQHPHQLCPGRRRDRLLYRPTGAAPPRRDRPTR